MQTTFAPNLLVDRVAVITGGGSGIGAGIAASLAAQGARVVLVGRTAEKLSAIAASIVERGGVASIQVADVRSYPAVEAAIEASVAAFGGLDVVINSAAGNFLAPAAALSANGFRSVIEIDLCGTFNVCRAAYEHLAKRGGDIVNITATQARIPTPLQCHAGAAKAGIEKLTRDLALEWGRFGIRVNAIAPGPIEDTEGMSRLAPGDAGERLRGQLPLGRFGTIEEIASAVVYLLSPAGRFITGSTLLIDGGTSLLGPGPFLELMLGK